MRLSVWRTNFDILNKQLASANFAMVMSTGIVSMALYLLDYMFFSRILFIINIIMFIMLWGLYLRKLVCFPRQMAADFRSHVSGPGFLTIVAGTCVLGTQFAVMACDFHSAQFLFWLGVTSWIIILWGVFCCIFTSPQKPVLASGINGTWLIATVSTQSIVILGATIAAWAKWDIEAAFFLFSALFCIGLMLYFFVITIIFYRFCFAPMSPRELEPTYWINASAVAITSLAGSTLILHDSHSIMLAHFMPFIKGATLLGWATAAWWIPMLFLLGIWRQIFMGHTWAYTPTYWGMVFPMGMFTVCTASLSNALDFPWLMVIPHIFIWIAVIAWGITFTGMLVSRLKKLFLFNNASDR